MRSLIITLPLLLGLCAGAALAQPGKGRKEALGKKRNARILDRRDLEKAMKPHALAIQSCYQKHAAKQKNAKGPLNIELIIRPEGAVKSIRVVAPGVKGKGLERCVVKLSKGWRFPEKPGFTHAVLPYYFLKTNAKGAGPLQSCWSAKGCPKRIRKGRK